MRANEAAPEPKWHAYIGAALMSVNLKGDDRLKLQVQCSGPVRGLSVEANAFGEVRGYLAEVPIPAESPVDPADLSPLFGEGVLTVTRFPAGARQPFSGQVALQRRGLAENLTHYFLTSEQAGSVFQLSAAEPRGVGRWTVRRCCLARSRPRGPPGKCRSALRRGVRRASRPKSPGEWSPHEFSALGAEGVLHVPPQPSDSGVSWGVLPRESWRTC
jgi:hypothetical protein